jgi:hypothetical protein
MSQSGARVARLDSNDPCIGALPLGHFPRAAVGPWADRCIPRVQLACRVFCLAFEAESSSVNDDRSHCQFRPTYVLLAAAHSPFHLQGLDFGEIETAN